MQFNPIRLVIFFLFGFLFFTSFDTNKEEFLAMAAEDKSLLGKYIYEDSGGFFELSLMNDGYFLERMYSDIDDHCVSLTGKYTVKSEDKQILLVHSPPKTELVPPGTELDHSVVIVDQNTLILKDKYELKKTESKIEHISSIDQAVGEYFLAAYEDKSIQSMVELNSDGSFEQAYFYSETGEKYLKKATMRYLYLQD